MVGGGRLRRVDRAGRRSTTAILARVQSAGAVAGNRVLRRFWVSQMLSEIGDWVGLLGIAALLYEQTGQAVVASASLAALYLPYLFAPWLVGVCSRIPPRTLLIGADLLRGGIIMMLLLPLPAWALLLLVFLASIPTSVYDATRAAAVPEYAPDPETRDDALVLFQSTQQAATMLGFLLGGAALVFIGYEAAIILNAVSFLISGLLLVGVPYLAPLTDHTKSAMLLVRAGVGALRGHTVLRRAIVLSVISASTIMAGESLVVVYGVEIAHSGLAGPLAAVMAAVAAVLSLMLPRHLPSRGLLRVSEITMVVGGLLAIVAFVLAPSIISGFSGYIALGIISATGTLTYIVAVREMVPSIRAPVFALAQVGLMGGQAMVAVAAGQLADSLGSVGLAVALWQLPTVLVALWWFVRPVRAIQAPAGTPPEAAVPESPTPSAPPAESPPAGEPERSELPARR